MPRKGRRGGGAASPQSHRGPEVRVDGTPLGQLRQAKHRQGITCIEGPAISKGPHSYLTGTLGGNKVYLKLWLRYLCNVGSD